MHLKNKKSRKFQKCTQNVKMHKIGQRCGPTKLFAKFQELFLLCLLCAIFILLYPTLLFIQLLIMLLKKPVILFISPHKLFLYYQERSLTCSPFIILLCCHYFESNERTKLYCIMQTCINFYNK